MSASDGMNGDLASAGLIDNELQSSCCDDMDDDDDLWRLEVEHEALRSKVLGVRGH